MRNIIIYINKYYNIILLYMTYIIMTTDSTYVF